MNRTVKNYDDYDITNKTWGAILILTRFMPFIMDDRAFLDAAIWVEEENAEGEEKQICYGLKIAEALMGLCFKHNFGIKLEESIDCTTY